MMARCVDKFGRVNGSVGYRNGELEPYIVDQATAGVTYICYTNDALRAIRRITEAADTITIEVGYGAWPDRATLTNYTPVNNDIDPEA